MPDLLFEIGTEDMPALETPRLAAQLSELAVHAFTQKHLDYTGLEVLYTPRRLALLVHNLTPGQDATTVALLEILPSLLKGLRPTKSMRWDCSGLTFVRPIRWLVCLYGDEVVPLTVGDLRADRVTHRVTRLSVSGEWIVLRNASDYKRALEEVSVIVDAKERRKRVDLALTSAFAAAMNVATSTDQDGETGDECRVSEEILVRIVNSVEYPTPIVVRIPLVNCLPVEVVQAVLSRGRIFIPVIFPDRTISAFIGFCDGAWDERSPSERSPSEHSSSEDSSSEHSSSERLSDDKGFIRAGFERAILTRLHDARFFFDRDRQHSLPHSLPQPRPLAEYVRKLRNIDDEIRPGECRPGGYRFGSLWDKTERIRALAAEIAEAVGGIPADLVDRAAFLCKADLATELVRAFPELRGVAGGIYARLDKEPAEVATAIRGHYFSTADTAVAAEDRTAASDIAVVIGLADMLDRVVCTVFAGEEPAGVHTLIDLAVEKEIDLDFIALAERSVDSYALVKKGAGPESVGKFFSGYVRRSLQERYLIPAAVVASVAATGMGNFYRVLKRARALVEWQSRPEFQALATAFARVRKTIAGTVTGAQYDPARFVADAEQALWREYLKADGRIRRPLEEGDYKEAVEELIPLQGPIDRYLDEVVVIEAAEELKQNRLGFLHALVDLFLAIGDLTAIAETMPSRTVR